MIVALILAILASALPAAAPSPASTWLDATGTPTNWNRGAPLPVNAEHNPDLAVGGRCHTQTRPPELLEDKRLVANGWSLLGPYERFDGTVIIMGMTGVDGMCRPTNYQGLSSSAETTPEHFPRRRWTRAATDRSVSFESLVRAASAPISALHTERCALLSNRRRRHRRVRCSADEWEAPRRSAITVAPSGAERIAHSKVNGEPWQEARRARCG